MLPDQSKKTAQLRKCKIDDRKCDEHVADVVDIRLPDISRGLPRNPSKSALECRTAERLVLVEGRHWAVKSSQFEYQVNEVHTIMTLTYSCTGIAATT